MDASRSVPKDEAVSVKRKVIFALQESRILVLGTEVLLGFQFNAVFYPGYERLGEIERDILMGCHGFLVFTLLLLLAPIPYHRIACRGRDTEAVAEFTHRLVMIALLPLALVIALDMFIVVSHGATQAIGIGAAIMIGVIVLSLWYGAGWMAMRPKEWERAMDQNRPPAQEEKLSERIDRLMSESRIILPGVQALLGFQFAVTLTDAFERLSPIATYVHLGALAAMAIAAALLMAPAAYHRIATNGDATDDVLAFANRCVLTAMAVLSVGLSADIFVVVEKTLRNAELGLIAAGTAEVLMVALWFCFPLARRSAPDNRI
jgi:hypothetical protein